MTLMTIASLIRPAERTEDGPTKALRSLSFAGSFTACPALPIWDLPGVKIGVAQPDRDKERKLCLPPMVSRHRLPGF